MATKLVVSIVHSDDADPLISALRDAGFSSTKISTTGGFLREGNASILVGTEEDNDSRGAGHHQAQLPHAHAVRQSAARR